jgi:hypothetical protein
VTPAGRVEGATGAGLFLLIFDLWLDLLLLLGGGLSPLKGLKLFLRFLLFREPLATLCHIAKDGAVPCQGDFARKLKVFLGSASVLFSPYSRHGHSLIGR